MRHSQTARSRGFTLLELLVVVAILALLAGLVLTKYENVFERSRSATQAYSIGDVARQLQTYFALNHKYPEGWDTLMASPSGTTIYANLAPELESPETFLTTATLTDDQITSLKNAGVSHVFLHDSTSSASNSGTDRRHLGTGNGHDGTANVSTVVTINQTFTAGSSGAAPTLSDGMNLLVNSFGLNPNKSSTDSTFTRILANTYVVVGLGPKSSMMGDQLQDAPVLEHNSSQSAYSRALVVFEVPNAGTAKAKMVGVFGPDGRSKNVSMGDFNSTSVVPH